MSITNRRSTDFNGALPATREEARDNGALWEYAHMYDVVCEDEYRTDAVDSEASAREAADDALGARIDNEASAREAADEALGARIDNEASAREAADEALGARIDGIQPGVPVNAISPNNVQYPANATYYTGFAAGQRSDATEEYAVALGYGSSATAQYSVALGTGSVADVEHTVSVGNGVHSRRIMFVDDPVDILDAVNLRTLDGRVTADLAVYLSTLPDIEWGYTSVKDIDAGSVSIANVDFAASKTEAPVVLASVTCNGGENLAAVVQYSTTTGFTAYVKNLGEKAVENVTLDWLAVSGR